MVVVFLRGGLGNQMFQYAMGLHLAEKNKAQLVLDTTFLNDRFPRHEITHRTYGLDVFDISPKFTAISKVSHMLPIPGVWLGIDLVIIESEDILGERKWIKEKEIYTFDEKFLRVGGKVTLWGRWQSEKYFAESRESVKNAFKFKHSLEGEASRIGREIENTNSISIHVRRSDFVNYKTVQKIVGKTNTAYYDKAIAYMAKEVKNPRFFVFSDDIEWCRENIKTSHPIQYVENTSEGPKSSFHLQLMSMCKHNIVANSTYSWWGAWLNNNEDKIVVAPKRWQANPDIKEAVIPDGWIKL